MVQSSMAEDTATQEEKGIPLYTVMIRKKKI